MGKLIKYEFRKTLRTKLIVLGITAIAELVFLYGVYFGGKLEIDNNSVLTGIGLLMIAAFGSILYIGIESVLSLHRDMNTKQSYMLFLTPNSCYRILGAKVIENGLSIMLAGAFFGLLAALDITLLFQRYMSLAALRDMLLDLIHAFNISFELRTVSVILTAAMLLAEWLCTIVTAFLADVIACALLAGKRSSGTIGFVLFIALNAAVGFVLNTVTASLAFDPSLGVRIAASLVFAGLMYAAAAAVMERKLSV